MKLSRFKLPAITNSKSLQNDEKESSFRKLTIHNKNTTNKFIKIPKNVRTVNYNHYLSKRESLSKFETSKSINDPIKSFLIKNISCSNNLSPRLNLKKTNSQKKYNIFQNISQNKEKIFNGKNKSKTNDMNLFLFKLDKIFGAKNEIKTVHNIKQLLRESENPTNGNKLYSDTEEEKKESLTYFIYKNNMKNMIKKSLTKKIQIKKNILKIKPKIFDNFHIQSLSFSPFSYNDLRKVKYYESMAQEKIKNSFSTPKKINLFNINESKREKFKTVLRKKLKSLGQEMTDNKQNMKNINKEIESCLKKATSQLEVFAKSIEKENQL